jgi:hypothetical protein
MCSFAHGYHEKRNMNDPMPNDFPGPDIVGALHSNYKTQICKNFQESGFCKFSNNCCFAHGEAELRTLTDPMPPVPATVMLFNPTNAKQSGFNSTHVKAN